MNLNDITKEMLEKAYIIDNIKGSITPIAAGQRLTHRQRGESFVIKEVITHEDGAFTLVKDTERSWASFSDRARWESVDDMWMFLKFVDWAYGDPTYKAQLARFPHKCPRCTRPAYVGACGGGDVDCTNPECPTRKR